MAINAGLVSVKFDSIDAGSMSAEQAAQLLKCDYVLGTFDAVVQYGERWNTVDGKQLDRGFAPCGWWANLRH